MAPFKPFLSPRCKFSWSPELESTFQASKEAVIEAIRQGVEIFDIQRRTCLRPDWSKRGIGYFLLLLPPRMENHTGRFPLLELCRTALRSY